MNVQVLTSADLKVKLDLRQNFQETGIHLFGQHIFTETLVVRKDSDQ